MHTPTLIKQAGFYYILAGSFVVFITRSLDEAHKFAAEMQAI